MLGEPPLPQLTALSGGGVLGSKTRDFLLGGSGFSFSNLGILVASVGGSGGLGFGSSTFRPLVGSKAWLSVGLMLGGIGMPALGKRFTFTPESLPPPTPPQALPERWAQMLTIMRAERVRWKNTE